MFHTTAIRATLTASLAATLLGAPTFAQTGATYEMRLIPDGMPGSPGGPTPALTYSISDPQNVTATRVGFWLQARMSQTSGQNWGIGRASSPAGTPSVITVSDFVTNGTTLKRSAVNAVGDQYGRGPAYRNGGPMNGETDNTGVFVYPFVNGAENGGLDGGADNLGTDRIFGFDCYVTTTRIDADADADGVFHSPFGVNAGVNPNPATDPTPVPTGEFSPWTNLYRFKIDITPTISRPITLSATALLNGFEQIAPFSPNFNIYGAMLDTNTQPTTATYQFWFTRTPVSPCLAIDYGIQGGGPGTDGVLDNNDFIVFIGYFFVHDARGDIGRQGGITLPDGQWDNNDFVVFINWFFSGC